MNKNTNPWAWVSTLYYAEGIPYMVVITVTVILYKKMGVSNTDIGLYTSLLGFPWIIKPLWSPFVDLIKTKRFWIVIMQLIIAVTLAGVALTMPLENFLKYTLLFFGLMAFSSATHDIAADGFYMLGLKKHQQSFFVGFRSLFYRLAMITGQGLLIMLAGYLEKEVGVVQGWAITFWVAAALMFAFGIYHQFFLPVPEKEVNNNNSVDKILKELKNTFVTFFEKKGVIKMLLFLLLYRLGEAQLVKMASPFLLDPIEKGGLGLSTSEVGAVYGTVGVIALILGGILGGIVVSNNGLKYWLWWMVASINLPNAVYIFLSFVKPDSFYVISSVVAIEQFGYGFGFTAYMMYMIYIADGPYKTAHFALCTGFMALGMQLPGLFSGALQELIGYQNFFIWVVVCAIPGFIAAYFIPLDSEFGKKTD
ncbi:MFS transporter [Chondrinema litorale]|uniref:MFS transporter n=1 Tax=Chondrinema litorale TaxID=2994555 RepID=UPI002542904F|nr:MFS transporter [Chondrinema litorale]UZR94772.1 MFS transporter [Chondrinema litorale]